MMNPIYEAQNLCKQYGARTALADVSFGVMPGRLTGLVGPNGSGKTTLLKLSVGLLTPTAGQILIDGQTPGIETKRVTSYLPDRMALPRELRVADIKAMYRDFYADFDEGKAAAMLADLHLEERERIGAMSKGTQEKLALCLVMSRAAKLYLLDEPLGGVDPAAREYILRTILRNYSENAAVVISTHLIGEVETVLDEALILKEGHLLSHIGVDELREEKGMSLDEYFRDIFRY